MKKKKALQQLQKRNSKSPKQDESYEIRLGNLFDDACANLSRTVDMVVRARLLPKWAANRAKSIATLAQSANMMLSLLSQQARHSSLSSINGVTSPKSSSRSGKASTHAKKDKKRKEEFEDELFQCPACRKQLIVPKGLSYEICPKCGEHISL